MERVGAAAMTWDDQRNHDDVLPPLELADLAKARPSMSHPSAYRASWLLRKASLFDRLAAADLSRNDAEAIARTAREAGHKLQGEIADDLLTAGPLPEETAVDQEVPVESLLAGDETRLSAVPSGLAGFGSAA